MNANELQEHERHCAERYEGFTSRLTALEVVSSRLEKLVWVVATGVIGLVLNAVAGVL